MSILLKKINNYINELKIIKETWYHGTDDSRNIEKFLGFSSNIIVVDYVYDLVGFKKNKELMRIANNNEDKTQYFNLLNNVDKFKDRFKYIKPVFLTDKYSVAKTYADPKRAFDYQGAKPKIYEVDVFCEKIVKINAYGDRFRFIDVNKVKKGFIDAGINEKYIDEIIKMFTYYQDEVTGIKTDVIAAIGNWFKFDCIDVVGVLDSYHGGNVKSTVRMVLNPSKIKIKNLNNKPNINENKKSLYDLMHELDAWHKNETKKIDNENDNGLINYHQWYCKNKLLLKKYLTQKNKLLKLGNNDAYELKGDLKSKYLYHYTDGFSLINIIEDNILYGHGDTFGISFTTHPNLYKTKFVFQYQTSYNRGRDYRNIGVKIKFDFEKIKNDGYKFKTGNEKIGTFSGEREIRLLTDELINPLKYIVEIIIFKDKEENYLNISNFLKEKNIKHLII